ncbi:MAG: hypothetical protein KIS66_12210 [Fimbriimonadaceae bacterium]|nr:hypothetical protein [Fimbriimonadaceae bacterium]
MIASLALASALIVAPTKLDLKITGASLFKNGYAVVVREAGVAAPGEYLIADLPESVLGTLWITASVGVRFESIVSTNVVSPGKRDATNLDELLRANLKRSVTVFLSGGKSYTGELVSATGDLVVVKARESVGLRKATIERVESDGEMVWQVPEPKTERVVRVRLEAPKDGRLMVMTLERGLTWAPAYALDISDPKKLKLVAKATLVNELDSIEGTELRLVTGFPNMPNLGVLDPFSMRASAEQWLQTMVGATFAGRREMNAPMMNQAAFRGDFDAGFQPSPIPGVAAEDLFFYRIPNVTLAKGDRGYFFLFTAQTAFEHLYEWDIPDYVQQDRYAGGGGGQGDVWHTIRFKNDSGQPLTTGPALTMKNGEMLGQDMLKYTSVGGETAVKITKALDVQAEDSEEEIARDREGMVRRGIAYDRVKVKGTLEIENRKTESVTLAIAKTVTGEITATEGSPTVKALGKGLTAINPRQHLEWKVTVGPREKKRLTYDYTVYVNG